MPMTRPGSPLAGSSSRVVNGSMEPLRCKARRRSISAAICSGAGTLVYQSFHSSPSWAASTRPSWWSGLSGSRTTFFPLRVMGLIEVTAPS